MPSSLHKLPTRRVPPVLVLIGLWLALFPSTSTGNMSEAERACALHCAERSSLPSPAIETGTAHCGTGGTRPLSERTGFGAKPEARPNGEPCHTLAVQIDAACMNHCRLREKPSRPTEERPESPPPSPPPVPRADRTQSTAVPTPPETMAPPSFIFGRVHPGFFRLPEPPPRP